MSDGQAVVPALPQAASPIRVMLVAAVALVDSGGRVLISNRPPGKPLSGLWEFPGGKVEAGETPEQALVREVREELAIELDSAALAPLTFASHTYPGFHLLMPLYACRRWQGEPRAVEGQTLLWVTPDSFSAYPFTPADVPLLPAVATALLREG